MRVALESTFSSLLTTIPCLPLFLNLSIRQGSGQFPYSLARFDFVLKSVEFTLVKVFDVRWEKQIKGSYCTRKRMIWAIKPLHPSIPGGISIWWYFDENSCGLIWVDVVVVVEIRIEAVVWIIHGPSFLPPLQGFSGKLFSKTQTSSALMGPFKRENFLGKY